VSEETVNNAKSATSAKSSSTENASTPALLELTESARNAYLADQDAKLAETQSLVILAFPPTSTSVEHACPDAHQDMS
jgi:hypothetical protein